MCASTTMASLKFPLQDPPQQVASIITTIISSKLICFNKQISLSNTFEQVVMFICQHANMQTCAMACCEMSLDFQTLFFCCHFFIKTGASKLCCQLFSEVFAPASKFWQPRKLSVIVVLVKFTMTFLVPEEGGRLVLKENYKFLCVCEWHLIRCDHL